MNFHQLLQTRETLRRQARLADAAFAWHRLAGLGRRFAVAGLRGRVRLRLADPGSDAGWPALTALDGSQSVIEEHFTDEDVVELSDLLAFVGAEPDDGAHVLRIEDLEPRFAEPLRRELERAGVSVPAIPRRGLDPSEAPRAD
ncbi:MAG TPA: hypothetical protein VEB66_12800 [Opitutaceae bacterium]|nr:hypothetical protein [Opitutaceae bacterium]